jgi:hypothetical protein
MRLEHLYRLRFSYLEHWLVEGPDTQFFGMAEGRCEGAITGRFRGANSPRRRSDDVYLPDFDAIIETEDGATVAVHIAGFGRAREGEREVVGSVTHLSGDERYARLNDALCVLTGESRDKEIVIDVAELVWEPLGTIT